jgi:hypothetical protein
VIHINTHGRGRAKPGPWHGRYYEDWDAARPKAWVRGQAVPGWFYAGALWGFSGHGRPVEARVTQQTTRWRSQ